MENQLIITSISKGTEINQYIFIKEQKFIEKIISFFEDLDFNKDEAPLTYLFKTENYEIDGTEPKYIDINAVKDIRYNIKNDEYDIDIFIGNKKIILVIRTKKDKQKEISNKIFKIGKLINE